MTKAFLPLVAIILIAGLEVVAISNGLDGTVLSMSIGAIAGIAGYHIKAKSKQIF